jgi:hypothetical protein
MGYTHYWARPRVLPRLAFTTAVDECRRLCAALAIPLGGAAGEGSPVFSDTAVCFNGHVDSGRLTSVQRAEGLLWPGRGAHGIAIVGETGAVVGGWSAGPAVGARVLGPGGDGSYEAFRVERQLPPQSRANPAAGGWCGDFCKTNYRPYDLCVQGCLIVLSHHLTGKFFRVSSDGKSPEWNDARDACQQVLGYGLDWGEGDLAPTPPQHTP